MMENETVFAVVVEMFEYAMGPTYCECCGPESVLEVSGTHLDSVHRTREAAENRIKEIDETDIPEGYYYDNFEAAIWEVSLK